VGSKGIYEVRLDDMIDYSLFQETQLSVLKRKAKINNCSRSFHLNHKRNHKTVTLDFKGGTRVF
jgi:hypothetical protein